VHHVGSFVWFSTQVRGFKPGRSRRIFKGGKILSTPSVGGEVKPSVLCHPKCRGSRHFGKIIGKVPTSAAGISHVVADVEASKKRGKTMASYPYKLSQMQRTRAIQVAWMNSGLCVDRPEGWMPIIIIIIIIIIICYLEQLRGLLIMNMQLNKCHEHQQLA